VLGRDILSIGSHGFPLFHHQRKLSVERGDNAAVHIVGKLGSLSDAEPTEDASDTT
jgi:hypothetical protein